MSTWTGRPAGALLSADERWLAGIGWIWAPFAGGYTVMCNHAGAPAVMWLGSGVMALFGLWVAVVWPIALRRRRGRSSYEIDGGGLRVLGSAGQVLRRLVRHDIRQIWLETARDGSLQLWVRTRDHENELLFAGVASGSGLEEAVARLSPEPNGEA
jgi:hypothetical protein